MPSAAPGFVGGETEQTEPRLRLVTWKGETGEYQALSGKSGRRVRISHSQVPIRHEEELFLCFLIRGDPVLTKSRVQGTEADAELLGRRAPVALACGQCRKNGLALQLP